MASDFSKLLSSDSNTAVMERPSRNKSDFTKLLNPDRVAISGQPKKSDFAKLLQPKPSIAETGLPETPRQISAQFNDMLDPNTDRDFVFVGATTQDPFKGTDIPKNIFKVDSPAGTLYTTNKSKADTYFKNPTDETRSKILGYTQSKKDVLDSGVEPQAVIVKDQHGNRLFEELSTDPNTVIEKYKKQGYKDITVESPMQTVINRVLPADPQSGMARNQPEKWQPNANDLRVDGTQKGTGFLGVLQRPDGKTSTELSIGVLINGKETEIPSLVPTLNKKEIDYLLNTPEDKIFTTNPDIYKGIQQKAVDHAKQRITDGKSPFYQEGESLKPNRLERLTQLPSGQPSKVAIGEKPIGFIESAKREWTDNVVSKIPIAGTLLKITPVIKAAQRLSNPNYDYKALYEKGHEFSTKEVDKKIVDEYISKIKEEQQRGYTWGGRVAQGISALPTWMAEFVLTRGVASMAGQPVKQIGKKILGETAEKFAGKAAIKAAELTARAAARTSTGFLPKVVAAGAEKQLQQQAGLMPEKGWATNIAKAWGDTFIESFSEETGQYLSSGLAWGVGKLPFGKKFISGLSKVWQKVSGGSAGEFYKKIASAGGYSDIIGEIGEERLGSLMRDVTGVSDKEGNVAERVWEGIKQDYTVSNLTTEAAVLSVPMGGQVALSTIGKLGKGEQQIPVETVKEAIKTVKESVRPQNAAELQQPKTSYKQVEDAGFTASKNLSGRVKRVGDRQSRIFIEPRTGEVKVSRLNGDTYTAESIDKAIAEENAYLGESVKKITPTMPAEARTQEQAARDNIEPSKQQPTREGRKIENVLGSDTFYRGGEQFGELDKTGAVFFTDSESVARQYADKNFPVHKAKLTMNNPLDLRPSIIGNNNAFEKVSEILGRKVESSLRLTGDDRNALIKYAKDNGFDGLMIPDTDVSGKNAIESYVVFDKSQIISPQSTAEAGKAIIRNNNGQWQVKFPDDTDFGNLTTEFSGKTQEQVIAKLEKKPANKDIKFIVSQSSFNPPAPDEGGAKTVAKYEPFILTEHTSNEYLDYLKKSFANSTGKSRQKYARQLKSYKSQHKSIIFQDAKLNRPLPDKVIDEYRKEEWMQDYLVRNNEIALPETNIIQQAEAIYKLVIEKKQSQLDKIGKTITEKLGAIEWKGEPKSVKSITSKVERKRRGGTYDAYQIKDHARGSIILKDWSDAPQAIKELAAKGFKIEVFVDEPLNIFGYRGTHGSISLGDKINGEVQLHTKKSWAVKKATDPIYRKWRDLDRNDLSKLPKAKQLEYERDVATSKNLWDFYWESIPLEVKSAISASVKGLEAETSPRVTPSEEVQLPSTKTSDLPSSIRNKVPSSNRESIISNTLSTDNIARKSEQVKAKYTSIPAEWHNVDLMDWGKKGLRRKGDGKGRKNVFPNDPHNLQELPSRIPRTTMNRVKELAGGEFWSVGSMKKPTYYLAPKRVIEQVRSELGEEAFKRIPQAERSPKQKINDLILQAKAQKDLEGWRIGQRIRETAKDYGIAENDLTETQKNYIKEFDDALKAPDISESIRAEMAREVSPATETELDPDNLTDEQWLEVQDEQQVEADIDGVFDGLEESESDKDLLGEIVPPPPAKTASGEQQEFLKKEDYKTLQEGDRVESARLDTVEGQMKLPEVPKAKVQTSIGAAKNIESTSFQSDPKIDVDPTGGGGFVAIPGGRGERGKTQKPWLDMDKVKSPDADIEDFFGRTHRPPYVKKASSLIEKASAYFRERFIFAHHIPQTPETAYIRDLIRTMPEERRYAGEKAVKDIIAVLDGDGTVQALDSAGLDLLRRKVFVQDILNEAEMKRSVAGNFRTEDTGEFDVEKLKAEDVRLDGLIAQVPSVKKAYDARQKLWENVSQDLLSRGVLDEETAANRAYVRHFVLDLAEKNRPTGFKRKKLSDPYRAYSKHRKGSVKDISTDYLSVEVSALADIYRDNAVEDVANKIGEREDKRKAYTTAAKAVNFRRLVGGEENVRRIIQLRSYLNKSQEDPNSQESDMKLQRKQWIEELTDLDPTYPYRKRIAMHMSKIRKGSTYAELEDDTSSLFKELARLAKEEAKLPLGLAARGVFKAMAERDKMIRDTLGKEYLTPEKLAMKDDYVEWFYKRPNVFYRAQTLNESQIAAFVENSAEEVGDMLHIPKSKLRAALVLGRRKGMIIPDWLAAQLDDLPVNKRSGYITRSFTTPFIQFWKRWILRINPIRYNFRNQLGDTERLNASGQTSRVTYIPQALKSLITKEGEYYDLMRIHGVAGSSLWHEMNDVSKLKEFERFKNISQQKNFKQAIASLFTLPLRTVSKVGSIEQNLTQLREDVLRAAVFIGNYEDLKAGKPVRHWAGKVADIEAIAKEDSARAAAKISRETLGDYGAFTPFENDVLRQGLIPFYSWMKINGAFWPRVLKNAAKEGSGGTVAKIITGKIGLNIAKWLIRALWAYAAAYLWNHKDYESRKKEESLPFWLRVMPHINIGNVALWGQTALSDFMEWFGMEGLAGILWRHEAGFLTLEQSAMEAAKTIAEAPVNKVYQSLNPFLKAPIVGITGQSTYPNVFEPHFVAKPASANSAEKAMLDIMGGDAKKFYQTAIADKKGNRRALDDTLYAYFAGWFAKQTDPDTLIEEVQKTKEWTALKNKSKTTGRVAGEAKKGKEADWQEAKIRERALK